MPWNDLINTQKIKKLISKKKQTSVIKELFGFSKGIGKSLFENECEGSDFESIRY